MERRARRAGWAGSASAARSRSSTGCCAAPTDTSFVDAGRRPRACCRASATASRSTPTRGCRATPRKRSIGIIAHPLNRPRFDAALGRVTEGYGILQPRVSVTMASAAGSLFARALRRPHRRRSVHDRRLRRLPGPVRRGHLHRQGPLRRRRVHAPRSTAACRRTRCSRTTSSRASTRARRWSPTSRSSTTIPSSVLAHARRQHRWVRGDWQILRWLLPCRADARTAWRRNRLPLDRALEDPRQPAPQPGAAGDARACSSPAGRSCRASRSVWTHRALASLAFPLVQLVARRSAAPSRGAAVAASRCAPPCDDLRDGGRAQIVLAARVPRHATRATMLHAIVAHARPRRDHAAAAARVGDGRGDARGRGWHARRCGAFVRAHGRRARSSRRRPAVLVAARCGRRRCAAGRRRARALGRRAARRVRAQPPRAGRRATLDPTRTALPPGGGARETWRYFDTFVGPEDHGLPPDNVQDDARAARRAPHVADQHRDGAARHASRPHDLGFIDTARAGRARSTRRSTTIEGLERHEGHLLNWYDTATLRAARARATCRPSTAATSPARCSRCARGPRRRTPARTRRPRRCDGRSPARAATLVATRCDFRILYDDARGSSSRSATGWPTPRARAARPAFYDLLASEARLASFLAIAKGDVPAGALVPARPRRSRASTARPRSSRGARRCSST